MPSSFNIPSRGEVVLYEADNGNVIVDVHIQEDTVWLTQRQMGEVFGTSVDNIGLHLRNIYANDELLESETTEDFSVVQSEGDRRVARRIRHYNLDAIVSVGFRVNSKRAVRFRQWATRTLHHHLVFGYTLNEQRIAERGPDEAVQALNLLSKTLVNQSRLGGTQDAVVALIQSNVETWRILRQYDEGQLEAPPNVNPSTTALDLDQAVDAIDMFKRDLADRGEAISLFGQQKDDGLAAILGNVEQTMFGKPLYQSREERAANLLYFLVKGHPFTDGNKRIGALLFLLYLEQENIVKSISPSTLVALTLLIAQSEPANKDLMIRLVMNLLTIPTV